MHSQIPICMWQPDPHCEDCHLSDSLKCRFNRGDLTHFIGSFFMFAFPALIGMVKAGYTWYILGWIGFWLIFFEIWEIRILCSHCPYYAEEGRILHCIANYGSLKLWKFNPAPINKLEKIQLVAGFIILGGYPFPFLILGRQVILAGIALWALIMFFWTLRKYTCSRCVNFSCILNSVPQEVITMYVKRNPVIEKVWREKVSSEPGKRNELLKKLAGIDKEKPPFKRDKEDRY